MSQANNFNRTGRRTRNITIVLAFITVLAHLMRLIRSQSSLAKYAEDLKFAKDTINVGDEAFMETIAAAAATAMMMKI